MIKTTNPKFKTPNFKYLSTTAIPRTYEETWKKLARELQEVE